MDVESPHLVRRNEGWADVKAAWRRRREIRGGRDSDANDLAGETPRWNLIPGDDDPSMAAGIQRALDCEPDSRQVGRQAIRPYHGCDIHVRPYHDWDTGVGPR
jgi:hypothetical protein